MARSPIRILFAIALFLSFCIGERAAGNLRAQPAQDAQGKDSSTSEQGELAQKIPIAEIKFEGNTIFSSQELGDVLRRCLETGNASQLTYEERLFEYCTKFTVINHMRGRGYLRAEIGEPTKQEAESGLKITLPVEEGARYRIGNIKIDGVTIFPLDQIKEMLALKPGEVAAGMRLFKGLQEQLKKAYCDRGHIQYDYDVEPIFGAVTDGAGDGTVDLIITISEGPMFKIRKIKFVGIANTRDDVLRRELSLKEDETFSQTLFEESVERLNGLDLFDPIDWRKDVTFLTDEESGFINLIIKIKEKKPQ